MMMQPASVTRLGNLLDFGQFNFPKIPTFLGIFGNVSKSIIFLVKSFLGHFYRHLAIFSGHTANRLSNKSGNPTVRQQ